MIYSTGENDMENDMKNAQVVQKVYQKNPFTLVFVTVSINNGHNNKILDRYKTFVAS